MQLTCSVPRVGDIAAIAKGEMHNHADMKYLSYKELQRLVGFIQLAFFVEETTLDPPPAAPP